MDLVRAADAAENAYQFSQRVRDLIHASGKDAKWLETGTKLSGKVRRMSMDLTRALAEMRKP